MRANLIPLLTGLLSIGVKEGEKVVGGMEVGKLGIDSATGRADLFFMVYKNNSPVDPEKAPRS